MPFTPSHIVAVLPLVDRGGLLARVPASALVIGSMVPDYYYFLPGQNLVSTHRLHNVVGIDLVVGLVLWLIWRTVLARPLAALITLPAPRPGQPSRRRERLTPLSLVLAVPAIVVGALTHIVWDSFTHDDRWGVRMLPFLQTEIGPLFAYRWLQYGCGAAGLLVLAMFLRHTGRWPTRINVTWREAVVTSAGWLVLAVLVGLTKVSDTSGLRAWAYLMITSAGSATSMLALGYALGWRLRHRPDPRSDRRTPATGRPPNAAQPD